MTQTNDPTSDLAKTLGKFRIVLGTLTIIGAVLIQLMVYRLFGSPWVLGLYRLGLYNDYWLHLSAAVIMTVIFLIAEYAFERKVNPLWGNFTFTGLLANILWIFIALLLLFYHA